MKRIVIAILALALVFYPGRSVPSPSPTWP